MAIQKKFQGFQKSINKNDEVFKQTFYGTENQIDSLISSLTIGNEYEGKGFLESYRKTQSNAPHIYELEIEYTISHNSDFSNSKDGTVTGKKSAQLSVRNIQMPLEASANYRTNWNYYLIGRGDVDTPYWWETADTILIDIADRKNYMWIKSISELPLQPDEGGLYWQILKQPTKPGVEYYDMACFVVTISQKFSSAGRAGTSVRKTINTITAPQEDFNISGGNWKHDESTINYDGNKWIVTSTYTHSPTGWDTDLYY